MGVVAVVVGRLAGRRGCITINEYQGGKVGYSHDIPASRVGPGCRAVNEQPGPRVQDVPT